MVSYTRDVLERQSLSKLKISRGSPICEGVRKKIAEYFKKTSQHFQNSGYIIIKVKVSLFVT